MREVDEFELFSIELVQGYLRHLTVNFVGVHEFLVKVEQISERTIWLHQSWAELAQCLGAQI